VLLSITGNHGLLGLPGTPLGSPGCRGYWPLAHGEDAGLGCGVAGFGEVVSIPYNHYQEGDRDIMELIYWDEWQLMTLAGGQ
jgi:hypothetical protein